MGEKILDWIERFAIGKKSRTFFALLIISVILISAIFPYLDANVLSYNRINKRLDNLQQLLLIDAEQIEDIPELLEEYNSILDELKNAREKNIYSININFQNKTQMEFWLKFAGGGILWVFLGIAGLFQKKGIVSKKVLTLVVCINLALVIGMISTQVPTLGSALINATIAPVIQSIIFYLFVTPKKKE